MVRCSGGFGRGLVYCTQFSRPRRAYGSLRVALGCAQALEGNFAPAIVMGSPDSGYLARLISGGHENLKRDCFPKYFYAKLRHLEVIHSWFEGHDKIEFERGLAATVYVVRQPCLLAQIGS